MHTPNIYTVLISDMKNVGLLSQSRPPPPPKERKEKIWNGNETLQMQFFMQKQKQNKK